MHCHPENIRVFMFHPTAQITYKKIPLQEIPVANIYAKVLRIFIHLKIHFIGKLLKKVVVKNNGNSFKKFGVKVFLLKNIVNVATVAVEHFCEPRNAPPL